MKQAGGYEAPDKRFLEQSWKMLNDDEETENGNESLQPIHGEMFVRTREEEKNKNINALQTLQTLERDLIERRAQICSTAKMEKFKKSGSKKRDRLKMDGHNSKRTEFIEKLWEECWILWKHLKTTDKNSSSQPYVLRKLASAHNKLFRILNNLYSDDKRDKFVEVKKNHFDLYTEADLADFNNEIHTGEKNFSSQTAQNISAFTKKDRSTSTLPLEEMQATEYEKIANIHRDMATIIADYWSAFNQQLEVIRNQLQQIQQHTRSLKRHQSTVTSLSKQFTVIQKENQILYTMMDELKKENNVNHYRFTELVQNIEERFLHQMRTTISIEMEKISIRLKDVTSEQSFLLSELESLRVQNCQFKGQTNALQKMLSRQKRHNIIYDAQHEQIVNKIETTQKALYFINDLMFSLETERDAYMKLNEEKTFTINQLEGKMSKNIETTILLLNKIQNYKNKLKENVTISTKNKETIEAQHNFLIRYEKLLSVLQKLTEWLDLLFREKIEIEDKLERLCYIVHKENEEIRTRTMQLK